MPKETITITEIEFSNLNEVGRSAFHNESLDISENPTTTEQNINENNETYPEGGLKAYSVLFGSFIGLVANFGAINSIGAIQAYIATHQLEGIKTSTVSWIFSIFLAVALGNTIFVGPFFDLKGATWLLVSGTVLAFGGFMAVANSTTVPHFILSFSFCVGLGVSLNTPPLVGVLSHWFSSKRGAAMGVATVGGSVGGIVIPLMLQSLYVKVGFTWAIRCLAFFFLGCMICSISLCRERFIRKLQTYEQTHKYKQIYYQVEELFEFKSLLDPTYFFLMAGTFAAEVSITTLLTYLATYAMTQGMKESDSYILLTIFNATGVPGRLLPGYISDKVGHFNVMNIMLLGFTVSILIIWLPFGSKFGALYAFAAVCGFFSSSIFSLIPACVADITPVNKFGQRYGLLYFCVSVGNLFGIPLSGVIIGNGSKHQYNMFVVYCGILALASTVCWIVSRYYIVGTRLNVKI
ncbi:uncharacterized protein J8A68_000365 [[Candida] subhashii]|uniref:Major facilitator superfamily (MFS) profile domain-containing protein n=1 Tax=[Candida] subhashii TaxID=561895 RepID=A0A8J5V5K4_9ASCO|nr:uncharacterized protein J8A68_000365 [[Candida] subhashii]KAG7666109.1 hypothetical protein J8A68_000365 [[Candida] subhashii]